MVLIELVLMKSMYQDKRRNVLIAAAAVVATGFAEAGNQLTYRVA